MTHSLIIAIDGPAGSGKSTLANALAERLDLATLDTGATYRAVAALVVERQIDPHDADHVGHLAREASLVIDERVLIDSLDVTDRLRSPEVNETVSVIAANELVRTALVKWQRAWVEARGGGVVEGRDIGSTVFPDASVKLYLTADASERARRRSEEGLASIERRDLLDTSRAVSPLTVADDAITIDTTTVSVDEIVEQVLSHIDTTGEGAT